MCWTGMNQRQEGSVCEQQDKQEFETLYLCTCPSVNRVLCVQFMNIKGFCREFQQSSTDGSCFCDSFVDIQM